MWSFSYRPLRPPSFYSTFFFSLSVCLSVNFSPFIGYVRSSFLQSQCTTIDKKFFYTFYCARARMHARTRILIHSRSIQWNEMIEDRKQASRQANKKKEENTPCHFSSDIILFLLSARGVEIGRKTVCGCREKIKYEIERGASDESVICCRVWFFFRFSINGVRIFFYLQVFYSRLPRSIAITWTNQGKITGIYIWMPQEIFHFNSIYLSFKKKSIRLPVVV